MTDRELREEFVRVDRTDKKIHILVREIRWDGPHTPVSTWAVGKSLLATASEAEIEEATARILEDDGYFLTCHECSERKPLGWMHDGRICQGCAQTSYGIVY